MKALKSVFTFKTIWTLAISMVLNLVYSLACRISNKGFIAVSGTKVFVVDSKTYTID